MSTEQKAKPIVTCRTCKNCGHRFGGMNLGVCMLSGHYCTTERKVPTVCGTNFEGWIPRQKVGIKNWLMSLWYGR